MTALWEQHSLVCGLLSFAKSGTCCLLLIPNTAELVHNNLHLALVPSAAAGRTGFPGGKLAKTRQDSSTLLPRKQGLCSVKGVAWVSATERPTLKSDCYCSVGRWGLWEETGLLPHEWNNTIIEGADPDKKAHSDSIFALTCPVLLPLPLPLPSYQGMM